MKGKTRYVREEPPMNDWVWKAMLMFIVVVLLGTFIVKALPILVILFSIIVVICLITFREKR